MIRKLIGGPLSQFALKACQRLALLRECCVLARFLTTVLYCPSQKTFLRENNQKRCSFCESAALSKNPKKLMDTLPCEVPGPDKIVFCFLGWYSSLQKWLVFWGTAQHFCKKNSKNAALSHFLRKCYIVPKTTETNGHLAPRSPSTANEFFWLFLDSAAVFHKKWRTA